MLLHSATNETAVISIRADMYVLVRITVLWALDEEMEGGKQVGDGWTLEVVGVVSEAVTLLHENRKKSM